MRTKILRFREKTELPKFLTRNKIPLDSKKVLIQVFTGIIEEKFIKKLQKIFQKLLPQASLIGTSDCGEIYKDQILEKETVIAFTVFDETAVRTQLIPHDLKEPNSFVTGQKIAQTMIQPTTKALIIFSDGLNTNGEDLLKGIEKISPKTTVSGGLASENLQFKKTFVFTKDQITKKGAAVAALDNPKLIVNSFYTLNWQNIGEPMTVTKAKKNRVYEINNQPILDIYLKYFGKSSMDEINQVAGLEFPLVLHRHGMKIARNAFIRHKDNSLSFTGNIKEDEKVQFGYCDVAVILESATNFYKKIQAVPFESIFIYSCISRKGILGQAILQEIIPLNNLTEVAGFFTYGEFFHAQDSNELLNNTMTVLTLAEESVKDKK